MRVSLLTSVAAVGGLAVAGQSFAGDADVIGFNYRSSANELFTTTTGAFVGGYTSVVGGLPYNTFAMDLTLDATTLWAVARPTDGSTTIAYGTIDQGTGAFNSMGDLSGVAAGTNISGMAVDPVSGDWYITTPDTLYRGDITTGAFTAVGLFGSTLMIDFAIDSSGNAYGHDIGTDELFSIDLSTGAATAIGPTGMTANFAQGMDFDYATDTLYATVYTGGGTGGFGYFDLNSGAFNLLEDTAVLNIEAEIVIANAIPAPGALAALGLGLLGVRRRRR